MQKIELKAGNSFKKKYMKKTFVVLLVFLSLASCKQKITSKDIEKLNGYWEIEKVVSDGAKDKNYSFNETFDYFEIKNNKGFRKKVTPQLDGSFLVNDVFENVQIIFKSDKTFLNYSTPYSKWSEELKTISDEEMVVVNNQKKEYHYKKTTPINLTRDGKTVQ